ncbi:unnamed protein product [Dovyalis caffra]|uniref:Uncharacterized protein n=1 Tax=Dovyalis caffra TaxID=77055 RepID=A0AAV1SJR4_9ROSI|nr:unnamed protein product [Dovyalis caffra]
MSLCGCHFGYDIGPKNIKLGIIVSLKVVSHSVTPALPETRKLACSHCLKKLEKLFHARSHRPFEELERSHGRNVSKNKKSIVSRSFTPTLPETRKLARPHCLKKLESSRPMSLRGCHFGYDVGPKNLKPGITVSLKVVSRSFTSTLLGTR